MPLTIALLTVGDHDTQGLSRLGKVMEVRSRRNMLDNELWAMAALQESLCFTSG